MVKPFAVLLVPAMARQIIREGRGGIPWRLLAKTAAVGSAAGLALSLPLWAGTGLVSNVLDNPAAHYYCNSIRELFASAGPAWFGMSAEALQHPYLDAVRGAVFAGGALWVLTRRASHRGLPDMAVQIWILFCVTRRLGLAVVLVPALALAPLTTRSYMPITVGATLGGLLFWAAWPVSAAGAAGVAVSLALAAPVRTGGAGLRWGPARGLALAGLRLARRPQAATVSDVDDTPLQASAG